MAAGRRERKKILLAKLETAYGTDPSPVPTTDAIVTRNMEFQDWQGTTERRNVDRPNLGNEIEYNTSMHAQLTFEVEYAGHGSAADSPPPWGKLLRMCSVEETINAATSVVYSPVDEGQESGGLYFYWSGKLHILLGARGTARLMLNAGSIPYIQFTMMGLRADPTDDPLPTNADFSAFQIPVTTNNANTSFSLAGVTSPDMRKAGFELDLGNVVVHRDLVGYESIDVTDRLPVGTVTMEDTLVADYDWDAAIRQHTLVVGQHVHEAGVAGRTLTLDMPKIQLRNPQHPNMDGNIGRTMTMNLTPDTGLDEWTLTQT